MFCDVDIRFLLFVAPTGCYVLLQLWAVFACLRFCLGFFLQLVSSGLVLVLVVLLACFVVLLFFHWVDFWRELGVVDNCQQFAIAGRC